MIKKYIQAAIVILVGGAAYFFVLGKSSESPVSRAYVDNLFHTYEVKASSGDFENYTDINDLTEVYLDIGYAINQIERAQTMYNRFLSKEHYYDDVELTAIEERYEELAPLQARYLETYLAPRQDFAKLLRGEMDDPAISIDIEGTGYKITIKGKMQQSLQLPVMMYYIDTAYGSYFFEEPDYTSASMYQTQYKFHGDTDYVFTIQP